MRICLFSYIKKSNQLKNEKKKIFVSLSILLININLLVKPHLSLFNRLFILFEVFTQNKQTG